jgi:ATP-dependent Clp protease ATP-binding subunit ClpC
MTSNAGVREISRDSRLGFAAGSGQMSMNEIESQAMSELKRLFNPEFLNRVDDVVVFHPLDQKQIEAILDIELGDLCARVAEQNYRIRVLPSARRFLVEKGWDPKFGGRPLRRTIQRELEDPLSQILLERNWPDDTAFNAACSRNGKIRIFAKTPPAPEIEVTAVEELEEVLSSV